MAIVKQFLGKVAMELVSTFEYGFHGIVVNGLMEDKSQYTCSVGHGTANVPFLFK